MAARVIHFGWDDCYRVPVLRSAGYEVREARSLVELSADLERDEAVGAVVLSEDEGGAAEKAASIARQAAPVILFRRHTRPIDESQFDRIFDFSVRPDVWLSETAALIAQSWALREQSQRIQAEAAAVRAEAAAARAESEKQRARARELKGGEPGGAEPTTTQGAR